MLSSCSGRKAVKDESGNVKHYFPLSDTNIMIGAAICDRQQKMAKFSSAGYHKAMEKRKTEGLQKPGFWQKAKIV